MDFIVAVNNFGDTRSGGLAGPMGLFIIVLLSVATVFLIRNMNKRLRRLPESFPDAHAEAREAEVARLEADLAAGTTAAGKVDGETGSPAASPAAGKATSAAAEKAASKAGSKGKRKPNGSAKDDAGR